MRVPTAWLAVIPFALAGCYGQQMLRQPVTVEDTARDTEAIRQEQAALEKRIGALEAQAAAQSELLHAMKAENSSQLGEMSQRLSAVDSKLDDALNARGGAVPPPRLWSATPQGQGNRDQGNAFPPGTPNPLAAPAGPPGGGTIPTDTVATVRPGNENTSGNNSDTSSSVATEAVPHDSASGIPAADPVEIKRIYDQAYLDMNRGNYSLAVLGFREYLRRSPASDLSDNAQYWIGECAYAQRDFNQAIQEFLKVLNQYPRGDKVPAATLKIGYSFLQLEDRASARRYLNQVVEQFPSSDEATLARNKLHSIGN